MCRTVIERAKGKPEKTDFEEGQTNLDERTQQEEMLRGLHVITAKAIGRQVVTKGG